MSRLITDFGHANRAKTDMIMTKIRDMWGVGGSGGGPGGSGGGPGGSGGGEAAVDADELAGDVGAGGAGQEDGDALEVGGLAVAADHGAGGQRGGADRVGGHLGGEGGGDEAGRDCVAAHAAGGPGLGLGPGERDQAALGGAVAAAVAEGLHGLLGGDVDDPPPAAPGHGRAVALAQQEGGGEV